MPQIWITSQHTIIGTLKTELKDGPFVFACHQDDLMDCQVTINSLGESIINKARVEVSNELLLELDQDKLITELPQELEVEINKKLRLLFLVSRRVVRLIHQETQDPTLLPANELSTRPEGEKWSIDGVNWRQINGLRMHIAGHGHVVGKLTRELQTIVQELLDQGEEPLLALQHLYEAERSDGLRFKWIEATVAAELAIKKYCEN